MILLRGKEVAVVDLATQEKVLCDTTSVSSASDESDHSDVMFEHEHLHKESCPHLTTKRLLMMHSKKLSSY